MKYMDFHSIDWTTENESPETFGDSMTIIKSYGWQISQSTAGYGACGYSEYFFAKCLRWIIPILCCSVYIRNASCVLRMPTKYSSQNVKEPTTNLWAIIKGGSSSGWISYARFPVALSELTLHSKSQRFKQAISSAQSACTQARAQRLSHIQ